MGISTLYARSFRKRFFMYMYRHAVNHPHTNIILSRFSIPLVLKRAAKILIISFNCIFFFKFENFCWTDNDDFLFITPPFMPFVSLFVLPSRSWNYFKVLQSSNSSGVYLTNHSSESIHIWTTGTLERRLSFHDSSPQGPCPRVGLGVKI